VDRGDDFVATESGCLMVLFFSVSVEALELGGAEIYCFNLDWGF